MIKDIRKQVDDIKSQYKLAKATLLAVKQEQVESQVLTENIEQAINHVQIISQTIQQQTHEKISHVVTACLQSVFPDKNYEFKLRFERKRNRTEAKPILINDGHEIEEPLEEDSGGIVDVAAFTCQVCTIIMSKPQIRRLLILDEPFKFVSPEYRENVKEMLEMLAEDFKIQFIMVTSHQSQIVIGKEIQL